jgi:hypothetical protein
MKTDITIDCGYKERQHAGIRIPGVVTATKTPCPEQRGGQAIQLSEAVHHGYKRIQPL